MTARGFSVCTQVINGARGVPSTVVFDIITSQLGLAAYFGCLDDLRGCPAYVAAAAAASTQLPGAPKPSGSSPPRRGTGMLAHTETVWKQRERQREREGRERRGTWLTVCPLQVFLQIVTKR
jgi:hypothetical protein